MPAPHAVGARGSRTLLRGSPDIADGADASGTMPVSLQASRWKSPAMIGRYGERLLADNRAAAQLARTQGRGP